MSFPRQTTNMIAEPIQSRKRTLLVVDDDEGVRRSLQLIFGGTYETLLVENASEALETIKTHSVDAAILDIRMSGMSGMCFFTSRTIAPPNAVLINAASGANVRMN